MDIFCTTEGWVISNFWDITWESATSCPLKECKMVWRIMIWIYFVLQCELWRCHLRIWDSHPLKECKVVWRITILIYFVLQCEWCWFLEMSPEDPSWNLRQGLHKRHQVHSPLEGLQGSMENYNMDIFCTAVWAMLGFGEVAWGSKLKFEARSSHKDIKLTDTEPSYLEI